MAISGIFSQKGCTNPTPTTTTALPKTEHTDRPNSDTTVREGSEQDAVRGFYIGTTVSVYIPQAPAGSAPHKWYVSSVRRSIGLRTGPNEPRKPRFELTCERSGDLLTVT